LVPAVRFFLVADQVLRRRLVKCAHEDVF